MDNELINATEKNNIDMVQCLKKDLVYYMVLAGFHSDCRCSEIYKSRYVTKRAEQLPQKLKTEAATITAVVVPAALIIEPIDRDKMNCARNTILKITTTKIG